MLFTVSFVAEIVMFSRRLWALRRLAGITTGSLVSVATGTLLAQDASVVALAVAVVSAGRLFNLLRIIGDRMQPVRLLQTTRRTAVCFLIAQIALLILLQGDPGFAYGYVLTWFSWLSLGTSLSLLLITLRNIHKTRHKPQLEFYADTELPTVSVLIPARNETRDLEDCLRSLLANDYPKLEIIVLDDCSQDKTSDIIKSFAQDGVRFIKGAEPDEKWLAKNLAYERLSQDASGELLLFCGTDVRMGPHSVRALVTTLLNRQKLMVSVMPRRLSSSLSAAFIQPMRYWWELSLPRRLFKRPPVLSTCWLITADALRRLGGMAAVRQTILPEAYFARELVKTDDSYSFVRSDDVLDIRTVKSLASQRATAIRVRYPQLRRRPENVLALMVLEGLFLLGPFLFLLLHYTGVLQLHVLPLALSCLLLVATHMSIMNVSNPSNVLFSILSFPAAVLSELIIVGFSMYRYEFSVVDWRGRNVCIPVMRVVPSLPRLKE